MAQSTLQPRMQYPVHYCVEGSAARPGTATRQQAAPLLPAPYTLPQGSAPPWLQPHTHACCAPSQAASQCPQPLALPPGAPGCVPTGGLSTRHPVSYPQVPVLPVYPPMWPDPSHPPATRLPHTGLPPLASGSLTLPLRAYPTYPYPPARPLPALVTAKAWPQATQRLRASPPLHNVRPMPASGPSTPPPDSCPHAGARPACVTAHVGPQANHQLPLLPPTHACTHLQVSVPPRPVLDLHLPRLRAPHTLRLARHVPVVPLGEQPGEEGREEGRGSV